MAEIKQNPHLISKRAMENMSSTRGSQQLLVSEIFLKINNAKDKPKKIEILKQYNTAAIKQLLKGCFDPNIEWDLPEGTPPFIENDAPEGTEHSILMNEYKRLWRFVKGADNSTNKLQKETMFIQMLEGLSSQEAKVLIDVKNKCLNKTYKGLTADMVKEAFGWNEQFITPTVIETAGI
jgi:hypothetical protein|tara:strand:- start:3714 stop:4250 length:537 start_codon:yes stop_codon:yes gene_type:complete